MKKLLNILFWSTVVVYYFVVMGFMSERRNEQLCTDLKITVLDSIHSRFVTAEDIHQMLESSMHKIIGVRFDSINIPKIEQQLSELAPIRRVNIYKTIGGVVHIDIMQRTPVVRVINRYGESFYLDEQGEMLRHSHRYSAHVLVANGYINLRPQQNGYNVFTAEEAQERRDIMRELFDLANYINENRFWKAQIQQIYVNEIGEFELIPLVGEHVIVFGKFEKPDVKFSKLESFYRNGLNMKGWNTYSMINLKYEGQIVGTRKR